MVYRSSVYKSRRRSMGWSLWAVLSCTWSFCFMPHALASSRDGSGDECAVGHVLAHDMLYGGAFGFGITGLTLIAQSNGSNVPAHLAMGTLVGGGIGAVVGVVELSLGCSHHMMSYEFSNGTQLKPDFNLVDNDRGSQFGFKPLMGFQFEYPIGHK